jgi:hypothetical protein
VSRIVRSSSIIRMRLFSAVMVLQESRIYMTREDQTGRAIDVRRHAFIQ